MSKRKICVVTGSRAEYGLLYWLMYEINNDPDLELQIVVTGMHLSPEFGLTFQEIEKDGFFIDKKVEMLLSSDTENGISKSIGLGVIGFADAFQDLKPDIIVLLGDRFEALAAAIAAMVAKIPIAHIHGGEATEGIIDEAIRHSITKMATIHFPCTDKYAKRIKQLGEPEERIYNFGMPGLDNIYRLKLLNKEELETELNIKFRKYTAIVTYHPVTLENNTAERQIDNLLKALKEFDLQVIFTSANADTNSRIINKKIDKFVKTNPAKYRFYYSLGQIKYLSLLKYVDIMIGNSSSGITEAPCFKLPVVNIGNRQKGRVKAANIIDCDYTVNGIQKAISKGLSTDFIYKIKDMKNPYDKFEDGKTSSRIKEVLKNIKINQLLLMKSFNDLI